MSNQCPYCGSLRNVCVSPVSLKYVCLACEKFFNKGEQPEQTVFARITASPEVLAEEFVEMMYHRTFCGYHYYSMLTGDWYTTREEAIAVTVAKLKEVAE